MEEKSRGRRKKYEVPYSGDGEQLTLSFQDYLSQVVACFGEPYDDRRGAACDSLRTVCREFEMSIPKARKLLITAGVYSTNTSRRIAELKVAGKTIPEIIMTTGLSRASVCSYLPYEQYAYKMEQVSRHTEDSRKYRARKNATNKLRKCIADGIGEDKQLWNTLVAFEDFHFYTSSGLPFQYEVKRNKVGQPIGEITISRKENSKTLTRSSVLLAFHKVLNDIYQINIIKQDDFLEDDFAIPSYKGPKSIGQIFGISYIYSIFAQIGLIKGNRSIIPRLPCELRMA